MELTKSIKAYLYDKTTSPLYSTFIFTWCLWNWRIFYVTLFVSESFIGNKLLYIQDQNFLNWFSGVIYPLISTAFLILAFPYIANKAKEVSLRYDKAMREKSNEVEKAVVLTVEESIAMRLDGEIEKTRFSQLITSKDKDIQSLRERLEASVKTIQDYMKEKESLTKGLRILKAQFGVKDVFFDVTEKLNSLIQGDSLDIKVNTETFGEPLYGTPKQLSIIYMHDGKYYYKVMNEGEHHRLLGRDEAKAIKQNEDRIKSL